MADRPASNVVAMTAADVSSNSNAIGLSLTTNLTNYVQLSNICTGPEIDDCTENANTVLESRLPHATSADLNHLNAKSRDKLLLGWKFVTQMGRNAWAIASWIMIGIQLYC